MLWDGLLSGSSWHWGVAVTQGSLSVYNSLYPDLPAAVYCDYCYWLRDTLGVTTYLGVVQFVWLWALETFAWKTLASIAVPDLLRGVSHYTIASFEMAEEV